MRNIQLFFILFLVIGMIASSCNLDEEPNPVIEQTFYDIADGFEDWILPFDSVNQTIIYKNSVDSISVVVVERTFDLDERSYTSCRVDNRSAQCQIESINLAFPEATHPDNFQPYVSIFVVAPNELLVMANRVGINAALAQLDGVTEEIIAELPNNYSASYEDAYSYNGIESPAVIIETISLLGAVPGSIIPPKRMVLVKGFGIVEWDDYNDVTWTLEE